MSVGNSSSTVTFDSSTVIVKYLSTQARNYANHRKVMTELYATRCYPTMRQYFLRKTAHEEVYDFLIVKTGSRDEFLRKASVSDLKKAIETVIPGGTFADIHGDGNVADAADPGQVITSLAEFQRLRGAVERGAYVVEAVLEYGNPPAIPTTDTKPIDTRVHTIAPGDLEADPSFVKARDSKGYTALHWAASDSRLANAELLIAKGADINAKDAEGYTPLHRAIEKSPKAARTGDPKDFDYGRIVALLSAKGADVRLSEVDGYTPLHIAAYQAREDYVLLLLEKGADLQARSRGGFTPLHSAAMSGYQSTVDLLISRGADVLSKTTDGKSVADAADDRNHSALARQLRTVQRAAEKRRRPWWKVW